MMLGCYRQNDAGDPKIFVSAVASVLTHYPESVVMLVTDPVKGLPGKLKWLPSVAEVREACEAEIAPILAEAARRKRLDETREATERVEVSEERRSMAIDHYERNIRPQMEGAAKAKETQEEAQKRLPALQRDIWKEPLVIGVEFGKKLEAMRAGK
jgi:hypothetical protein